MAPPMQLLLMALLISLTALAQGSSPSGGPSPAPSPLSGAPVPFPPFDSPPAPPTDDDDDLPEDDSPAPSPASPSPSAGSPSSEPPLPSDAPSSGVTAKKIDQASSVVAQAESGGGGMSNGHKAGLAIGLILAAALVGLGGFVYKKRQENLRRAQYGIQMI